MSAKTVALGMLICLALIPASCAASYPPLVAVITNSADRPTAISLRRAVWQEGARCLLVSPQELWRLEGEDVFLMIVLGGPEAYEGVDDIVKGYLTQYEQADLLRPGAMGFFLKWEDDTRVVIVAGHTRDETADAVELFVQTRLSRILSLGEFSDVKVVLVVVGESGKTPIGPIDP